MSQRDDRQRLRRSDQGEQQPPDSRRTRRGRAYCREQLATCAGRAQTPRPYAHALELISETRFATAVQLASGLRKHFSRALLPGDIVGIVTTALIPTLRRALMVRGRPLSSTTEVEATQLSLLIALLASGPSGSEAGLLPSVALQPDVIAQRFNDFLARWLEQLAQYRDRVHTGEHDPRDARAQLIVELCDRFEALGLQDGETLLADIRAGLMSAGRSMLREEEREPAEIAGCLWELVATPEGIFDLTFLDDSGRVRIGKRQVRDRAKTRERREGREAKMTVSLFSPRARNGHDSDSPALILDTTPSTGTSPVDAAMEMEQGQAHLRLEALVDATSRQLQRSKDRGERTIGANLRGLLENNVAIGDLCARARLGRTQLYGRFKRIILGISAYLKPT